MSKPVWMPLAAILAVHDRRIAGHGGATGMCDMGMCHMMLWDAGRERPRNLFCYGESTLRELAHRLGKVSLRI